MSHDIIDNRQQKLAENINQILQSSSAVHFAVGYFFLSGFKAISANLTNIKEMRLLIGNTSNRDTIEQIAEGYRRLELIKDELEGQQYAKRSTRQLMAIETAQNIRSTMELMDPTDEGEKLIENLVKMIEEKRLQVRIYTKGRLHSKAYIFDYGQIYDQQGKPIQRQEKGIAIVGSSNLSLAGISHNTELNVIVHGNDNHSILTQWFNQLWEESEDFDETLMTQMKQSWALATVTPYDIYLKTLYMLLRERLAEERATEIMVDNEITEKLANFQKIAVDHAIQLIREYGGCFVADVVGLGKSFIGAAIVKRFEQIEKARPLIICPAPLIEMWERYNEMYHLNARVLSMGMLREDEKLGSRILLEDFKYRDRDFVLIDESHNLRNAGTQRYKIVETFLATGRQCCLLTATPRNKSAWDLYHQIKLFHQDDKTDLPIDPPDLKEYFKLVEKGQRQLPELLANILIRRTRNHIMRWYGFDSKTHQPVDTNNFQDYLNGTKRAYVIVGGKHQFFPKRELETIEYSIEDTYQGLYQQLRQYLGKSRKRQLKKLPQDELCYARYGLGNYVLPNQKKQEPYVSLQSAGASLRGLMRILLFKRFESSVYAFQQTIKKLIQGHQTFQEALLQGIIPAGEEAQKIIYEPNETEEQDLMTALAQVSDKYDINDFDVTRLQEHLDHDIQLLKQILELVEPITPEKDTKLQTLKTWLNKPLFQKSKHLIFTSYADTAYYLYQNLNPNGEKNNIEVIYSGDKNKAKIVGRFAPKANNYYQLKQGESEIKTLIATDVLAEGLNLQDGNIIINYDLHWNPVKLIQRFGRIDRIGSENDAIYGFNFLPETALEKNLGLQQKLANRIKEIHETIGEDAAILDPTEKLNEEAMYAIYETNNHEQLSLFEENQGEFLDLNEAEEILRQLQRDNPREYERITNLPHGIRTAKFSLKKGIIVFCEASYPNRKDLKGYQQLYLLNEQGEIISQDLAHILGILKTTPEEKGLPLPKNYNQKVMKVKSKFTQIVKHRHSEKEYRSSLTQAQKYILKELGLLFKITNNEDIRKQINILEQAFRQPLTTVLKRELNRLKRESFTGEILFQELKKLYTNHALLRT
jgi:superfamily II DNA/RNA helicase